jgi:mRNA interferase MazF
VKRGEVWWALIDERRAVVLLSGEEASEFRAMQIVAPATIDEKRGFVLLSGEEACEPQAIQLGASASDDIRGVGVEVEIGTREGLPHEGVVRVALPRTGHTPWIRSGGPSRGPQAESLVVPCTWLVTLTQGYLIERAGALSSAKLAQLENALRLAGIE